MGVNAKRLAEQVGLEESDYLELLDLFVFVDTAFSDLSELQEAMDHLDSEKVWRTAHSIKGAAANFRFSEIFEAAKRFEMNAKEGRLDEGAETVRMTRKSLDSIGAILSSEKKGHVPSCPKKIGLELIQDGVIKFTNPYSLGLIQTPSLDLNQF